jgi:hypothetical protein
MPPSWRVFTRTPLPKQFHPGTDYKTVAATSRKHKAQPGLNEKGRLVVFLRADTYWKMHLWRKHGNQPGAGGYLAYLLLNIIVASLAMAAVLLVLWTRSIALYAYQTRGSDLAARAVLKPGVSEDQARRLADKLSAAVQGLSVNIISPAEGRALLALQEPWMSELPEIQVGRLPVVLEIRHPKLLTSAAETLDFNTKLEQYPEVDFVMFNSLGYEELVRFGTNLRSFSGWVCGALISLIALVFIVFNFTASGLRSTISLPVAILNTLVITGASGAIAVAVLTGISRVVSTRVSQLPQPGVPGLPVLLAVFAAILFVLEIKNVRLHARRMPRKDAA